MPRFTFIRPLSCPQPSKSDGWLHEPKWLVSASGSSRTAGGPRLRKIKCFQPSVPYNMCGSTPKSGADYSNKLPIAYDAKAFRRIADELGNIGSV